MKTNIKEVLKTWRGNHTQEEAAMELRVSLGTYRNWEHGRNEPRGAARMWILENIEHPISGYYAWLWRSVHDAESLSGNFTSLDAAKKQLQTWIAEWPEAEEYGIDHEDSEGNPVADFLSEAIKQRIVGQSNKLFAAGSKKPLTTKGKTLHLTGEI